MKTGKRLGKTAALLTCAVMFLACADSRPGGAGSIAPPYSFETWDGQTLTQDDFVGRPVVLNFWATWCVPCRQEMPAFQRLYSQYRDQGVAVVGIAVQDDPVVARQFIGDLGITYPTGGDLRNQSFQRFRVLGLPTTLSIGKDGKIIRRWDGELDEQRLGAMLRELVSAS
ncbi:MAG TPA: TlpA disulfide reductase family protein [Chloroflexota bacterium]